ncbi:MULTISPECIES: hypothetical protein [unclassified Streptomyces]|uniref:hypothetical protein n=1 Tax=unclassified Streptomyces TaxID=2593676 RepID=UPI000DC3547F|nr:MULTISPECIES: hypothetical protein [unclassified Streptomyces]MYT72736.1 hypothetical protein [Streptomyces sp. SID8367]RAJ79593.1 hypothetical protein K377_05316 [Streptomyces sp. PsTaAH-137]
MELTAALLSVLAPLAPAVKGWLDSVAQRNRAVARAEIIRARRLKHDGGQEREEGDD